MICRACESVSKACSSWPGGVGAGVSTQRRPRRRWQVRAAGSGDVCGVRAGGRVPGVAARAALESAVCEGASCVLGAGWKGWCTPPGEGRLGSGAPLPPFKKTCLWKCV